MAMLLLYVGENRFAIQCSAIVRVLPRVLLNKIPFHAPNFAGLMLLGGQSVPVVDFCQIIAKRAARPFINSRIILLRDSFSGSNRCIGLLAEKVEEIIDLRPDQFDATDFCSSQLPYIDKGHIDEKGMIYSINLEAFFRFLSASLFHEKGSDSHGP